jgi:hypothetical protein
MSISAAIEMVWRVPEGIKLELTAWNDKAAPAGQSWLTIYDPTWIPEIGMYVDGCGEVVTIQRGDNQDRPEGIHSYYRAGYQRLYENFNRAPLLRMAYWDQYGRARGEAKP